MAMRSATAPRRVYPRAGSVVICLSGKYFGPPAKSASAINSEKEVRTEVLPKSGGKARIKVTQGKTSETWVEKNIEFASRATA